ncbi:MAG: TRAP transporter small permease [Flavobacteriaceae bacterium]
MRKLKKVIAKFLKYGTLVSSLGFIIAICIQIYARFFLESAPSWTEEAARFFFIYAVSFGAGLAMKDDYYVQFDVLFNRISKEKQLIIKLIVNCFTIVLFIILAVFAVQFVIVGIPEHSPSLAVPMAFAFISMVIMGVSVALFSFFELLKNLKNLRH